MVTDPIADMLTRIRNANAVNKETVEIQSSKMKEAIAEILKKENFIKDYEVVQSSPGKILRIVLRDKSDKESYINGLKRISKPGRRIYVNKDKIPRVLNGHGIAIISTSKGLMTDEECRKVGIGGEVLCYIW